MTGSATVAARRSAGRLDGVGPGCFAARGYVFGDHLGSVSLATNYGGTLLSQQDYYPWGEVRTGDIPETTLDFTGQRRDGIGSPVRSLTLKSSMS